MSDGEDKGLFKMHWALGFDGLKSVVARWLREVLELDCRVVGAEAEMAVGEWHYIFQVQHRGGHFLDIILSSSNLISVMAHALTGLTNVGDNLELLGVEWVKHKLEVVNPPDTLDSKDVVYVCIAGQVSAPEYLQEEGEDES